MRSVGDGGELNRAGVPVEHGDAEQEDCRRERAEQEVLHRRFLRQQPTAPGETAQQVQRQRQHLEPDEHGQQIVGRREQQHAADGKQRQRIDLGVREPGQQALSLLGAAGDRGGLRGERADLMRRLGNQQNADESQDQDGGLDEEGWPVNANGPDRNHGTGPAAGEDRAAGGQHDRENECPGQAAEGQRNVHRPPQVPRRECLDQHASQGSREDEQHRGEQAPLEVRRGDCRCGSRDDPGHAELPCLCSARLAGRWW